MPSFFLNKLYYILFFYQNKTAKSVKSRGTYAQFSISVGILIFFGNFVNAKIVKKERQIKSET